MQATLSSLTKSDLRTIFLSLLGGAIEVYDFVIFVFLATIIADVFFPTQLPEWLRIMQSLLVFSVGYLARPLGGLVLAHYADRFGRKWMFNVTIVFMALPCLLIGLLPGFETIGYWAPLALLLARIIQGMALGGEVPNAWVFVAEHTSAANRGLALGLLQAGLSFGYMLGALSVAVLSLFMSSSLLHQWGWRIPFLIGGGLGFVTLWLRRWLQETPAFTALERQETAAPRLPLKSILNDYRHQSIPALLLTALLASAVVACVVVFPLLMQKNAGISANLVFWFSCLGILTMNAGCVLAGYLTDKYDVTQTVRGYAIALVCGVTLMIASLGQNPVVVCLSYILLGLSSGIVGVVPRVMVSLFPTEVKVTGISLMYNLAYSISSGCLPLLLLAVNHWSVWYIPLIYLLLALAVITIAKIRPIPSI